MSAPWCMVASSFLFALMGVCVKWASSQYSSGEIVFYRALVGVLFLTALSRHSGVSLRTAVPAAHFWRSASGVSALMLWFYAFSGLPLATAMTLNYMSSVWMALFLIGGAVWLGEKKLDHRVVAAVLTGFVGVALVLQPTISSQQLWHGLMGLLSGMLSAMAYLQVATLGRSGEPEQRIVFYFSLGGVVVGAVWMAIHGVSAHTVRGLGLLLAIGLLAVVAQMLMTRAYRIGRTLSNAVLNYLGIAHAFALGVLLFDDPVTLSAIAGMLLIVVAGIAATALRNPRAHTETPPEV